MLAIFVFFVAASGIRIVPQARAGIVERLGRYARTLDPGLTLIVPFIDRVKPLIDLREQVVAFPPQPVITEDNLVVGHRHRHLLHGHRPEGRDLRDRQPAPGDRAAHGHHAAQRHRRPDARGDADRRDNINSQLRVVLDEATGKWGIRVNRVELKSVEPPRTVQEAMEKQMRAERDRRAAILTAEGIKQSQILTAEGEKQAAVLKAEGARTAAILRAEGESKAIETVFQAIHEGRPDQSLLSYQYLQMLPQLAQGAANKIWVIPSEFSQALGQPRRAGSPPRPDRWPASAAARRRATEGDRRPIAAEVRPRPTPRTPPAPLVRPTAEAEGASQPAARDAAFAGGRLRRPGPDAPRGPELRPCRVARLGLQCSTPSPRSSRARSQGVRQRGALTEEDISRAMREIRLALLEADVNFKVVKQFTAAVKERAAGDRGREASSTPASRSSRSSTRSSPR